MKKEKIFKVTETDGYDFNFDICCFHKKQDAENFVEKLKEQKNFDDDYDDRFFIINEINLFEEFDCENDLFEYFSLNTSNFDIF